MRDILNRVVSSMTERNMNINGKLSIFINLTYTGFVSNGEYNSMRANGYSRPLSVLQIKVNARKKYSRMGKKAMIDMLTPKSEVT